MPLTLCVLLWAVDGQVDPLTRYEDEVLALVPVHGGRVASRVRSVPGEDPAVPAEVQVIEMPDDAALAAYMADPARVALADVRDRVVARTQIVRVEPVADRG
ncbi:hypothetical protein [Oerskovia sp. USHLN155]|uniref:hypothetical protein n=1 Tax=Oerskovia sp. USHLN155 TaxID=3081288 RepID=UPI003016AC8A